MTTRSQKRKAIAELRSVFEMSVAENSHPENLVAGPSKSPNIQSEKLDEYERSLRKKKSDLTEQKETLKLIAQTVEKLTISQIFEDFDTETEITGSFNIHTVAKQHPLVKKIDHRTVRVCWKGFNRQ